MRPHLAPWTVAAHLAAMSKYVARPSAIRVARARADLTLAALGALVDREGSHIARIESGERMVSAECAAMIADALGCSVRALFRVVKG